MRSRAAHQFRLFADRHALHASVVVALACLCTGGLLYLAYVLHVWRVAVRAPVLPVCGECVLLFGKHSPGGRIDGEFAARVARAATLASACDTRVMVLLGGGPAGVPSEAELARRGLSEAGLDDRVQLVLEDQSRDTLQNLRNARALLQAMPGNDLVTLLSSRYHLARCALFARLQGMDWELCAAEARLPRQARTALRIAGEAAYVCWLDVGTRWARLIGHRAMLRRVT